METVVLSRREHKSKLKREKQVYSPSGVEELHTTAQSSGIDDGHVGVGPGDEANIGSPRCEVECVVTASDECENRARRKKCKRSRRHDREDDINGVEEEEEERVEDLTASKKRNKERKKKERDSVSVNGLHPVTAVSQSPSRNKRKTASSDDSVSEEEEEKFDISDSEIPPEGVESVPGNEELEFGNGNKKRKKPEAVSKPSTTSGRRNLREEAEEYLQLWSTDRAAWAFRKKIQYWLLQNMFDKKQVSKRGFKVLLCYLEGLQGNQRQVCVDRAHKILEESEGDTEPGTPRRQYRRAVALLRTLA